MKKKAKVIKKFIEKLEIEITAAGQRGRFVHRLFEGYPEGYQAAIQDVRLVLDELKKKA